MTHQKWEKHTKEYNYQNYKFFIFFEFVFNSFTRPYSYKIRFSLFFFQQLSRKQELLELFVVYLLVFYRWIENSNWWIKVVISFTKATTAGLVFTGLFFSPQKTSGKFYHLLSFPVNCVFQVKRLVSNGYKHQF